MSKYWKYYFTYYFISKLSSSNSNSIRKLEHYHVTVVWESRIRNNTTKTTSITKVIILSLPHVITKIIVNIPQKKSKSVTENATKIPVLNTVEYVWFTCSQFFHLVKVLGSQSLIEPKTTWLLRVGLFFLRLINVFGKMYIVQMNNPSHPISSKKQFLTL